MKLITLILFLSVEYVSASEVYSQETRINLVLSENSISEALSNIEKQTSYLFFYNKKEINVDRKISLTVTNKPVSEVLSDIFGGTDINYSMIKDYIVLTKKNIVTELAMKQQQKLSGIVTDASNGDPIIGANVILEGTTNGVTTDVNGKFNFDNLKPNAVLIISYMGYNTERVAVNGQPVLDIKLIPEITKLDEVVVIGYGTLKKRDVTGSSASFKAENIDERPLTRIDQALVGQMAGVQVKQTTGTPGKAFSIQVRGSGSITAGNEPLYVIDGFPLSVASQNAAGGFSSGNPLDNMNPNDIESIQVLKDAASAAIYGSRAANGVVLITTKHGKSGKPQISFNSYTGFCEANRKLDMMSSAEWIDRAKEMIDAQWVASGTGRTAAQSTADRRAALGLTGSTVNTTYMTDDRWSQPDHPGLEFVNWQNEAFRQGVIQNYQLSANGGNDFANYYLSLNTTSQKGIIIGMDYTSYSARSNVQIKANDQLRFGINLTPTYSVTNDPGVEGKDNILHQLLSFTPVQEDTMKLMPNTSLYGQYKWSNSLNSPIEKLKNVVGKTSRTRILGSFFAEYEIIKGLTIKSTINYDNTNSRTQNYVPYTVASSLATRLASTTILTTGSLNTYTKQTFVNENTIAYNTTIAKNHNISLLAGAAYNNDKLTIANMSSNGGFNSYSIKTLNAANAITGTNSESKNVLISYFGRAQYNFQGKYIVSASIRNDGSSRFGDNSKWGIFPSVSVGWRISDESFMKSMKFLNDLKLRLSYGKSGNYNIGDYSSVPVLANANYTFNSVAAIGQTPSALTNPNLTWEESNTTGIGIDISIIDSRITGAFDYYNKLNTNLLLNIPIPQSTGFATSLSNIGKVRNQGWEIELTSRNLIHQFQWTTSVNISHNKNKVVALGDGQTQILIPSLFDISHTILKVGEQMNSIYAVRQTGILSQADIDNKVALYGTETAGDPKYADANGDGLIDANDRVIVGHPNPTYVWGVTNTFKFKGFDLSVLVQGQNGGSIYSLLGRALGRTGQGSTDNFLGGARDRWRSADNPGSGKFGKAYSTFGRIVNTDWLYSSDYWRIRNITLGYDLGKLINKKILSNARVYVTAENWFGKDKYTGGLNPEASNTDLSGNTSFPESGDYGGLPLAKSMVLGLNITF